MTRFATGTGQQVGVVYGLLTAIGYGGADFLVTHSARRVGPLRSLYLVQLFGLIIVAALALLLRDGVPPLSITWLWALGIGVVDFAGIYFLYRAFSVGSLSVCSPIASSYTVITGLLAWATGERLPGSAQVGTVVLVVGVVVVSRGPGDGSANLNGVPSALAAAGFLGVAAWGLDILTDDWGWLWPVIAARLLMLLFAAVLLARSGKLSPRPEPGSGVLMIAATLFDTMALIAFNLGLRASFTTTTTALGSLYNAVAILLALLFLKERLARVQWAGLAAILAGILLVSV